MIVSLILALLVLCPFVVPTICSRLRKRGEWTYVDAAGAPVFQNGWMNERTREPSGHLRRAKAEGAGWFSDAARDFDAQMRELRRITSR